MNRPVFVLASLHLFLSCANTMTNRAGGGGGYAIEERSVAELSADMAEGLVSSELLVELYLDRINALDRAGPTLGSVLCVNPNALADARERDAERERGELRGALHGIPVLLKDNIESADPMPTTAGSLALVANRTDRDAPIVARLRAAGAVILGKANLSEWANIRSTRSSSGWSAVGGLTRNPYSLDRTACGSSSGSGVAVAANLVSVAVGTETDGSVTCPAAMNGIVGLKPTVGLLSRRHIVPISHTQDTAGPMGRKVADVAVLLEVMAGTDEEDPATAEADDRRVAYTFALRSDALRGKRLGVMMVESWKFGDAFEEVFEAALDDLRAAGAEITKIVLPGGHDFPSMDEINSNELTVLIHELKTDLDAYLADTAAGVETRSLAEVIAFNEREAERELVHFGQELFLEAQATEGVRAEAYLAALEHNRRTAGPAGIDRVLSNHRCDALIAPTTSAAFPIDLDHGDRFLGAATMLPAVSGYPHLTVPMGLHEGLPVGLSFIGPAWSEARLLAFGHAYELQRGDRPRPTYAARLP